MAYINKVFICILHDDKKERLLSCKTCFDALFVFILNLDAFFCLFAN